MEYFKNINDLTELQKKRIQLLQQNSNDAHLINSEFMLAKDIILRENKKNSQQCEKKLQRLEFTVEKHSDSDTYVKLKGQIVCVSIPPSSVFRTDLVMDPNALPKVNTPATMVLYLPPLTKIPLFSIT